MTSRGDLTKKRLLDAAERLFAERGIDAVSLREVNAAAGERNNAALYYHFRNRVGLITAITDRHLPIIAAHQQVLLEQAERDHRLADVRTAVEVIVRPSAEYITAGPSERAWLRIAGELGSRPETAAAEVATASSAAAWSAGASIVEHLTSACSLPHDFAVQRIWRAMATAMYEVASRARYEDTPEPKRAAPPIDLFIEDLLDTTCAALTAPISEPTRRALNRSAKMERLHY